MTASGPILGVVLAGGKSARMGADKAFVAFDGRPLIARAIERLRPQVAALAVSANADPDRFAAFGLPILADAAADRDAGPLAGVAAALAYAEREAWPLVATAPCDAPFAPEDFVSRLTEAQAAAGAPAAVAESPRGLEPLFALWRADLLVPLRGYLDRGGRGAGEFLIASGAARARFRSADAFANLNTPAELAGARAKVRPA